MTSIELRQSLSDKRQTLQNSKSEVLTAKIISNYGDSGIDETYHADLLSRFVIVMIESTSRVLTTDRYSAMIALVRRPRELWVNYGPLEINPVNQTRTDYLQNISKGIPGSFSVAGISRISPAYQFGETIKIRRLPAQSQAKLGTENSEIFPFNSTHSKWDTESWGYGSWHSDGSTLVYFQNQSMKDQLRLKAIDQIAVTNGVPIYQGILHKYQFEAFILNLNLGNPTLSQSLMTIFDGSWNGNPALLSAGSNTGANGGYAFHNVEKLSLNCCAFEDVNEANRARVSTNSCLPLVVSAPSSWPTPSVRNLGSISYNPSYSPITR